MPLPEIIHHFVEWNGEWPSHTRLREFTQAIDVRMRARKRTGGKARPWVEEIEDARAYRTALGLDSPTEMPKKTGRGNKKPVCFPPDGLPGAPKTDERKFYERTDVLAALRQFVADTPRGRRSEKQYGVYATDNELPSVSTCQKFGGYQALLREAERQA
jgi:hypothetical protein